MKIKAIALAILAAALYGISTPFSKVLLKELEPALLSSLLYFGAGIGMLAVVLFARHEHGKDEGKRLERKDFPYVIGMILLDILAPISLMTGLMLTNASTVSLLNNFEVVATTLIALIFFKENVGKRMWIAIGLITLSSILLSIEDISQVKVSIGVIFVLIACISWGLENNCTRMLSLTDPAKIVTIKGLGAGTGALIIHLGQGGGLALSWYVIMALLLGVVAYGMSIFVYIRAQRDLGAARTSAFYAIAPFLGVIISWFVLRDAITGQFIIAFVIMIAGSYYAVTEDHAHEHLHEEVEHTHEHSHNDGHHDHDHGHDYPHDPDHDDRGMHTHKHRHEQMSHTHQHMPDMHHVHSH